MKEPKAGLVAHLQAYSVDEVLPGAARHLLKGAVETIQNDDAEIERLRAAIWSTASQGTYDELAIRKAVGFELAELIVAAHADLQQRAAWEEGK